MKKISKKKPLKKPEGKDRAAEREVKTKSLADFLDKKVKEKTLVIDELIGQEQIVCPFCKWRHEAEDFGIKKQTNGTIKCSDCGEAVEFEAVRRTTFTTFIP